MALPSPAETRGREGNLHPPQSPACPPRHGSPWNFPLVGLTATAKARFAFLFPGAGHGGTGARLEERMVLGKSRAVRQQGWPARWGHPAGRLRRPVSSCVSLGPRWGSPQPGRVLCRFAGLRHASALAGGCPSRGCPLPVAQAVLPGHGPGIRVWCLADADPQSTRSCLCHRRASPFP